MDSRTGQKSSKSVDAFGRAPKKRFRIEKLEERIAPKKGGNGSGKSSASSGYTTPTGSSIY